MADSHLAETGFAARAGRASRPCAVILAAGQGTRLRPLTDSIPKCLVEVAGKPILRRQLDALSANGILDTAIVVGYRANKIRKFVKRNFRNLPVRFVENPRYADTNTFYSLALAAEAMACESVIQLNGDLVFDAELVEQLLAFPREKSCAVGRLGACGEEEIKFCIAADGRITEINKRIPPQRAAGEAIGLNKFSGGFWRQLKRALKELKEPHGGEYFEFAVERVIRDGGELCVLDAGRLRAVEVDFYDDWKAADKIFSS